MRTWLAAMLFVSLLGVFPVAMVHAQSEAPSSGQPTGQSSSASTKPEAEDTNEQFRHAGPVQALGHAMGMSTEVTAQIFEDINSAILIFVIGFFLIKALPKAFSSRSETIQKQLVDARSATEQANQRLSAVEARLAKLGDDIAAIRQQTEQDMVEDEKRIKQSLEDERQRIVKAAEQEIASAGATAQRDLKRFAAELSIDRATKQIKLTAESDKALVERFGKDLAQHLTPQFTQGERN